MKIFLTIISCLVLVTTMVAKEVTITGKVTDENGDTLPGATVQIKKTAVGTQTNFDGLYSIQATKGAILIFSYVGYITQEIKIKDVHVINVQLQLDNQVLDEVVVMGYSTQKKISVTSSVTTIGSNQINGMLGRTPGVQVSPGYMYTNESYATIKENGFQRVGANPLSTFSIDVDKAGYSNLRRMINNGMTIEPDAVKIEEMVNYFDYNYPQPTDKHPFSITTDVAKTPWNAETKLVRIGLQGKIFDNKDLPPSNLTFLIDVSGSMSAQNKLPLLKQAFKLLVNQLREQDKVAMVVYAGAAGMVLPPTSGSDKVKILEALDKLEAGGSTAGGDGIELAYSIAKANFIKNGNNRVILATDGDFNVGASSDKDMETLIETKRTSGIYLSVLGFGMGNYKDSKLEILADKGNGNHAYVDTMQEAQKVFGKEFGGTLYTIAKDVKIQIEFNPEKVQAYRLIGYENRMLNAEDFIDDTKDAGELGAGHTVTALYEVIPIGVKSNLLKEIPELKYTKTKKGNVNNNELFTVKFRYKKPEGNVSNEIVHIQKDTVVNMNSDFGFAAAVALFGMQLKKSEYANNASSQLVIQLAEGAKGEDKEGYRVEFIRLVKSSENL